MTDKQFIALMALMMCSDPWPTGKDEDNETLVGLMDDESRKRGYDEWISAFHKFEKEGAK